MTLKFDCEYLNNERCCVGGCSKNLSLLYASPDTCDSPMLIKQQKETVTRCDPTVIESATLPEWPLHCKFQSNLSWMRNDLTPPSVVQQFSRNIQQKITMPDLNDDSVDNDVFNDIMSVVDPLKCHNT